jgi:hypothetical protein
LSLCGQETIDGRNHFRKFFKTDNSKNLLIIGENHSSSAGAEIYPPIIKDLNRTINLNTLLVEFGPSEAYFYTKYLETGNERHLNYTIYAGAIEDWRIAWRQLYQYNKTLKNPLKIIGIDFDRTRTFAYALYSMFSAYDSLPEFIKPLLKEIRTDDFYRSYTVGYPTKKDIEWTANTKSLLQKHVADLKLYLKPKDLEFVAQVLDNKAVNYAAGREEAIADNTRRIIEHSKEHNFLLLIGRSHAYLHPIFGEKETLANIILDSSSIRVLTGVMLFENAQLKGAGDSSITLFEIRDKMPWKRYYSELNKKAKKDYTVIPLRNDLCPLSYYVDFVMVVRNTRMSKLLQPAKKK